MSTKHFKMKKFFHCAVIALSAISIAALSSCSNDDDEPKAEKPSVTLTEVGHDNTKTVEAGKDLHLEAEILAPGVIKEIEVEIHQENGGHFEIEKKYIDGKYIGVKNVEFHEHIDIPADAPAGEYHLHLEVTDAFGQTAEAKSSLTVTHQN